MAECSCQIVRCCHKEIVLRENSLSGTLTNHYSIIHLRGGVTRGSNFSMLKTHASKSPLLGQCMSLAFTVVLVYTRKKLRIIAKI